MTPGEQYADVRARITAMVFDLPEDRQLLPVPACPNWTVRDVVAHVTGITADVNAGRTDGVATDPWTNAQVEARRDTPLNAVLAEWAREAATFERAMETWPKLVTRTVLVDLVTHEHDIRGALGVPGGRDNETYELARKGYAAVLAATLAERGLPGLRLEAPDWSFDAGEPVATMRTKDSHEIFRALAGRRSKDQVLAYDWTGDPTPYLPALSRFGELPDDDVIEQV